MITQYFHGKNITYLRRFVEKNFDGSSNCKKTLRLLAPGQCDKINKWKITRSHALPMMKRPCCYNILFR